MDFAYPAWASPLPIALNQPANCLTVSRRPLKLIRRRWSSTVRKIPCAVARDGENAPDYDVLEKRKEDYFRALRQVTEAETALSNPHGTKMSHEMIQFDTGGLGPLDRYVYVEEQDCIGCTHCATTAPGTFFLEDAFGRARVYNQLGDTENMIAEAIDTCPVNCIYYVEWEDLVKLELMRKDQKINNWARLVGGQDARSARKGKRKTKVMDSGVMRCEDCPGRGCRDCPLYGVGENPEYLKRKSIREARKREKKQEEKKRSRRRL